MEGIEEESWEREKRLDGALLMDDENGHGGGSSRLEAWDDRCPFSFPNLGSLSTELVLSRLRQPVVRLVGGEVRAGPTERNLGSLGVALVGGESVGSAPRYLGSR